MNSTAKQTCAPQQRLRLAADGSGGNYSRKTWLRATHEIQYLFAFFQFFAGANIDYG
jgi:hypothetical protein